MATLNAQKPSLSGLAPTFSAAGVAGDEFANTGREYLHVKNADAVVARTVTIDAPNRCNFEVVNAAHDLVINVPASGERLIGPFPAARFNDANGKVQVSYDDETDLTVAVVALT